MEVAINGADIVEREKEAAEEKATPSSEEPCANMVAEGEPSGLCAAELLREVKVKLREQTARHQAEQEMLIERLLAGCLPPDTIWSKAAPMGQAHSMDRGVSRRFYSSEGCNMQGIVGAEQKEPWNSDTANFDEVDDAKAVHAVECTTHFAVGGFLERMEMALFHQSARSEPGSVVNQGLQMLASACGKLAAFEEPERSGRIASLLRRQWFSSLCMVCIALNAIFLVFTTDVEMANLGEPTSETYLIVEGCFMSFYFTELVLKLSVHRMYFFWCEDASWNILDLVLVLVSVLEMVIAIVARKSAGVNVSFMRSFRLFKVAKILRVFRSVRFFKELKLMFDCVVGSVLSLVWCLVMIFFVIYVFSLFLVQTLTQELANPDNPWTDPELLYIQDWFGSVGHGMITLLQSTTGGIDWGIVYGIVSKGGTLISLAFVGYVLFFALCAWNIVTSLFVEKALKLAQPDIETIAFESNLSDSVEAKQLTAMFQTLDSDGTGRVSLHEMRSMLKHPMFRRYMRARGMEVTDPELFYRMVASVSDGSHSDIDIELIVGACMRMKGHSSSLDMHALNFESKLATRKLRQDIVKLADRLDHIDSSLYSLAIAYDRRPTDDDRAKPEPEVGGGKVFL